MGQIKYPWYGTYEKKNRHVENDITTLMAWISNKITTRDAARRIANNNFAPVLRDDAFVEVVGELGWIKDENGEDRGLD